MIIYRNRLIIGLIKQILTAVLTVVYKILSLFNLQFTLLIALVGLVLFLTGVFASSPALTLVYKLILIFSVVYAVVATLRGLLGLNKNVKKSKGAQIIKTDKQKNDDVPAQAEREQKETPVYFRVKQNPEYVMAEYSDRYELFRIVDGGLKKIRVDYK